MSSRVFAEPLKAQLMCKFSHEPLTKPVIIVPCGDRIQKKIAKERFGDLIFDGWKIGAGMNCPVCDRSADGYIIDKEMRIISKEVFDGPSFPGEKAVFVHSKGDFEPNAIKQERCRMMKFVSTATTAFIQKFEILGYKDGEVKIWIKFDSNETKQFIKFLKKNNVDIGLYSSQDSYRTRNINELQSLFRVISENSTFPAHLKEKVEKIIALGKTEKITTLREPFGFGRSGEIKMLLRDMLLRDLQANTKTATTPLPYPGISGKFVHQKGNFEPFEPKQHLCRHLKFKSETPGSLINRLQIFGYIQGNVHIRIDFDPINSDKIDNYFASRGVNLTFTMFEKRKGFYRTASSELKAVFDLFAENNSLPVEFLNQVKEIVEMGKIPRTDGKKDEESIDSLPECHLQ